MRGTRSGWKEWWPASVAVAALVLFAAAGPQAAGPRDYVKYAPGGHEVFVYLDVAQIRNSKLYSNLKNDLLAGNAQAGLAAFEQFTGIRVPDDLDVLAASGKIAKENQGCVYVHARMDRQRIESMFAMNPGYSETIKPGGKMIGFLDEGKGTMSYMTFLRNDLVVVGQKEGVEGALGVAAGEGASLADNPAVKTQLTSVGTSPVLMVLAQRPTQMPPDMRKVPAIEKVQSLLLTVVPGPETLTLIAQVEAETQELAGQFLDMARGLIALGQLQEQAPQIREFAELVTASRQGKVVTVKAPINTAKAENLIRQNIHKRRGPRPNVGGQRVQGRPEAKPIPPQW